MSNNASSSTNSPTEAPEHIGSSTWWTKCWFIAIFHVPCEHWSSLTPPIFIHRLSCPGPVDPEIHCRNLALGLPLPSTSLEKCPRCKRSGNNEEVESSGLGIGKYEIWNGKFGVDIPTAGLVKENVRGEIGRVKVVERGDSQTELMTEVDHEVEYASMSSGSSLSTTAEEPEIIEPIDEETLSTKCRFVTLFHTPCRHWAAPAEPTFIHRVSCPGPVGDSIHCANMAPKHPLYWESPLKCPSCIQWEKQNKGQGMSRESNHGKYVIENGVGYLVLTETEKERRVKRQIERNAKGGGVNGVKGKVRGLFGFLIPKNSKRQVT